MDGIKYLHKDGGAKVYFGYTQDELASQSFCERVFGPLERPLEPGERINSADGSIETIDPKGDKTRRLNDEMRLFIEAHYAPHRQSTFMGMLAGANVEQTTYINQFRDWVKSCLTYYYSKEDEITNAADEAAVDAITWNFDSLAAADPVITIRQAMALGD